MTAAAVERAKQVGEALVVLAWVAVIALAALS
jgi:hypothetical protein